MKTIKHLTAKVLAVQVKELGDGKNSEPYVFEALEFANGLILVEGESTNDWFFDSRSDIKPCGNAQVVDVQEVGRTEQWTSQELLKSVQGSIWEFGEASVPSKHFELWK